MAKKAAAKKEDAPYNAAGLTRKGVADIVIGEEFKRMGTHGYPWSDAKQSEMVEACNGLKTGADIIAKIKELAKDA